MRHISSIVAGVFAGISTSLVSAGFTTGTYVQVDVSSSNGDLSLFNTNGFQTLPGGPVTFIGGAPFGQSDFGYMVGLSTEPDTGGSALGGQLGTTDVAAFSLFVTNSSTVTHFYTLAVSFGIVDPWSQGTLVGGTVGGTLTDLDGGGATMSAAFGNPLMTGQIDGVGVLDIGVAPFLYTAAPGGSTVFSVTDGLPGPTIPGPMDVNSTYGVLLTFALGAGDQAVIDGEFQVQYVPGPASMALLAVGMTVARRRRRS